MDKTKQVEEMAMSDYQRLLGKTVVVGAISGFVGSDTVDVQLDSPAKVTIQETSSQDIKRWVDDWCDPIYNVTLAEPHKQLEHVRSLWVYGPSRHRNGLQTEESDIKFVAQEPVHRI